MNKLLPDEKIDYITNQIPENHATQDIGRVLNLDESLYSTPNKSEKAFQTKSINTENTATAKLELALRNITTLVSADGKILRKDGTEIR